MVEEASAAAGSLEQQSGALSSAVAEFKLDTQARSAPAAAHVAPAAPKARLALSVKKATHKPQLQAPAAKPGARKELSAREEGWQEF
jgi:hypothetical protein